MKIYMTKFKIASKKSLAMTELKRRHCEHWSRRSSTAKQRKKKRCHYCEYRANALAPHAAVKEVAVIASARFLGHEAILLL